MIYRMLQLQLCILWTCFGCVRTNIQSKQVFRPDGLSFPRKSFGFRPEDFNSPGSRRNELWKISSVWVDFWAGSYPTNSLIFAQGNPDFRPGKSYFRPREIGWGELWISLGGFHSKTLPKEIENLAQGNRKSAEGKESSSRHFGSSFEDRAFFWHFYTCGESDEE